MRKYKSNSPKLTQKQLAPQLGFSNSTIRRYGDQKNMPISYNGQNTKRKKMSSQDRSITVRGGSANCIWSVNAGKCETAENFFFN